MDLQKLPDPNKAPRDLVIDGVLESTWPLGLETNHILLQSDNSTNIALTLSIGDDGSVYLTGTPTENWINGHTLVIFDSSSKGGKKRRTRQALLWWAKAIELDNAENGGQG